MIQEPLRRDKESGEDELWHEGQGFLERVKREGPDLLERLLKVLRRKVGVENYTRVDDFFENLFTKDGRIFSMIGAAHRGIFGKGWA